MDEQLSGDITMGQHEQQTQGGFSQEYPGSEPFYDDLAIDKITDQVNFSGPKLDSTVTHEHSDKNWLYSSQSPTMQQTAGGPSNHDFSEYKQDLMTNPFLTKEQRDLLLSPSDQLGDTQGVGE